MSSESNVRLDSCDRLSTTDLGLNLLMPAIYLTEDDVRELLDVETAIEVVEAAFRSLAEEKAVNVPRTRARARRASCCTR